MIASRIALIVSLMVAVVAPCAVMAQDSDEVVSANTRAKLPTQAELDAAAEARTASAGKSMTTDEQIIAWLNHAPQIERETRDGALWPDRGPDGKRKVHGGAGVSVGTGGYRSGYVYSLIPLGENGTLGLSYSQTDFGENGGYGYGYGYGGYGRDDYGYGYGYPGYGHGRRGGTSQSFGLSLDMTGDDRRGASTPAGCAPGFRAGDRYVEPLWVTEARGNRSCLSAEEP